MCPKKFGGPTGLKRHVSAIHLQQKSFLCDVCNKSFSRQSFLKQHKQAVHEKVRFSCSHCCKSFSRQNLLNNHIKTVHSELHEAPLIHACEKCEKKFATAVELERHKKYVQCT